jgi:16S rRNA (guanine966-N2)-methyltransferase
MRVIGGEARGRILSAPKLASLRPTSDRVREAVFDILEARDLVVGSPVADLFAGSGALGIEALSRGASACTFVDSDPVAVEAVRSNLDSVGYSGREGVRVVRSDVTTFLRGESARVRVAFVDPPYRFSGWAQLLAVLGADYGILEHRVPIEVGPAFHTIRTYRYGGTLVTLVARLSTDKDPA